MRKYCWILLILGVTTFTTTVQAQVDRNRLGIGVSSGFVFPSGEQFDYRINGGGEVALSLETSLLPRIRNPWLFGGAEFAFQHFGRGNVTGMESFLGTLFLESDLLPIIVKKDVSWITRIGVGWGTFYNYIHPNSINGDKRDAFFGIYIPLAVGYQVTDWLQIRVSGRGYIATAQVGDKENLQQYFGLRLQAEYLLP